MPKFSVEAPDDFGSYAKELFKAPSKGSMRIVVCDGYYWRFKSGIADSLEVSDDSSDWRDPREVLENLPPTSTVKTLMRLSHAEV